jgi:hypothetical protein
MKIADVGELHTQAMWTIVVTEVAFRFHEFMRDCTRS